jgi:hypothetical protein
LIEVNKVLKEEKKREEILEKKLIKISLDKRKSINPAIIHSFLSKIGPEVE